MYDPPTVIPLLQQPIPDAVAIRLKGWQDKAALLPLEHCMEIMREDFRHYSEVEPSAPVELLVQWANTPCGQPAAAAMLLWLGELFAEAHPKTRRTNLKPERRMRCAVITTSIFGLGRIRSGGNCGRACLRSRSSGD